MKTQVLTFLFLGLLLTGCQENVETKLNTEEAIATSKDRDPMQWETKIQLNDGKKWQANRETSEGITNMLQILEEKRDATEKDSELSQELNTLIAKCTMKGPPHDNLHIYLKPLIVRIAELHAATSEEKKKELRKKISEHLEAYKRYFK